MRTVIENIELIRESRNISKKELSAGIGISPMAYSRLSNKQSKLSTSLLVKISNFFGINDYNVFFNDELTDSVIHVNHNI